MISTAFSNLFSRYPRKSMRLLEVVLPLVSLSLITMPFWGSFLFPVELSYFIIFFDVYWFYKSINLVVCSYIASEKIHRAEKENWLERAKSLEHFSDIHHIIVIPNYKEGIETLRKTLDSIVSQTFPVSRIFVVVALEEREKEARERQKLVEEQYADTFGALLFTYHPDREGEVKGKSSNQAYAGRIAYEQLIEKRGFSIDYFTISSVDADTIFDRQYFSYLSYAFLTAKKPYLSFWQSANVHYNNFWDIPTFTRIISFFGSLWRTSLLVQGLRLIPNSTYSLSLKLLHSIDFWDTDVIPEDYRIFFKAFFNTRGMVEVHPIYLKTSMDAPLSHGYVNSLMNKYNQERRWSWGISDDALYVKWFLTIRDVPFFKKTYLVGNVILDHILWPVNWYIITIAANVVAFLNPVFTRTTLGYNLPRLSGFILTLCLFALLAQIIIDYNLRLHYEKGKISRKKQFLFLPQFIFMPIAGFFLSSFPALISHIQLLLGKRLEYKVTEKI